MRAARTAFAAATSAALAAVAGFGAAGEAQAQKVVGWIEPVRIEGGRLVLEAKLDTGADHSSLDARDIRRFERDGRPWVSFAVLDADSRETRFERPLERIAMVTRASGGGQERPVVRLRICLDGVERLSEVNLVDRGRLKLPMLLGRSYLEGHFAVDSARTRITAPDCKAGR